MGKNTTKGDKKIVLQDQLYEEILNGFEEVPGSVDAKSVQLKTIYKNRVKNVSESFFANVQTHQFLKTWAGNLSGTSVMDEMLEKMMSLKQEEDESLDELEEDADEEYLQNDYDEKREKNIFNVLGFLRWIKFVHIVRDLYNVYQKYKTKTEVIVKEYKENFEGIIDNDALSVEMKTALCIDKIEGLFKVIWKVSLKAGEALRKFIDENKTINGLFDHIEEEVWNAVKSTFKEKFGLYVGAYVSKAFVSAIAPEPYASKFNALVNLSQGVLGLYNLAEFGLLLNEINKKGLLGYSKEVARKWFIKNWNLERSIRMRDEIRKSMEGMVVYGMQLTKDIDDLDREVNNSLNVKKYIDDQIEDFRSDVTQDFKTAGQVVDYVKHNKRAGANFESNIIAPQIQVHFDFSSSNFGGENLSQYSSKVVDMQYSIIDQIKRTHELRYNFVLTDKTFENLYGQTIYVNGKETTTGLLVLHVLKVWENNLIESAGHFYSLFYQYINDTAASFIEKVDSTINEIDVILKNIKFPEAIKKALKILNFNTELSLYKFSSQETRNKQKDTNENVDWETMLHTETEGLVITPSQPKTIKVPQQQEKEEVKKLRLSEKTLQSFHTIIGANRALTGMQIELLDENDKEIKLDIKNWTTYGNIRQIDRNDNTLPAIENYFKYMSVLDTIIQYEKSLLALEQSNDEFLSEILTNIQSKNKKQ